MARAKKINRESSFVTLRTKAVSKGRLSYYLDIYKDGVRKYEFLKLYIVPATNEAAKVQNANTEQAAMAIRNQRELEIIQGKGGLSPVSNSKLLLVDWMEEFRKLKLATGQSEERALSVEKVKTHLKAYAGEKVKLSAVELITARALFHIWEMPPAENIQKTPSRWQVARQTTIFRFLPAH